MSAPPASPIPGVLAPHGIVAAQEQTLLIDSVLIMLAIIVPTMIAIFAFAYWFRSGNARAARKPHFTYSGAVELLVWGVPLLTIMLLGGVSWIGSHRLDPGTPVEGAGAPLEIQAVSLDWKWLFIYPGQGIATVNQLAVPVGRKLHFSLTSATVMNTFFVPQLGSMIYTMNGMTSQLWLRADEPGTYRGMSSHFSGDGFSDMNFPVHAMSESDFTAWIAQAKQNAARLDNAAYGKLAERGSVPPALFGSIDPSLFPRVAKQSIGPAPMLIPSREEMR